jgi:uncharacterized protein YndB with AHSA1/START domain
MDKIEKVTILKAPRDRVWHAITDSKQFGTWFGVDLDGPFEAGKRVIGKMTPTKVDPEVAARQEPYKGFAVAWHVDKIEPMTLFSFQWHPFAIEKDVDYSNEPMTTVSFELSDAPGGTQLRITETGFDRIPLERRAKAFAANDGGWAKQIELVTKYLSR